MTLKKTLFVFLAAATLLGIAGLIAGCRRAVPEPDGIELHYPEFILRGQEIANSWGIPTYFFDASPIHPGQYVKARIDWNGSLAPGRYVVGLPGFTKGEPGMPDYPAGYFYHEFTVE